VPIDVKCSQCEAKFRVPDKFAGKRAKCPKCQGSIAIPAPKEPAAASKQPAAAPRQPAAKSPVGGAPVAEKSKAAREAVTPQKTAQTTPQKKVPKKHPPAKKPPPEDWYLQTEDGEQYGPISRTELDEWVAEGRVDSECQVLREGWDQWRWAEEVYPELAAPAEEAQPVETSAPPPMPVVEENPFAGIADSPATISTGTPPSMPGVAAGEDQAKSGFSLPSGVPRILGQIRTWVMVTAVVTFVLYGILLALTIIDLIHTTKFLKEAAGKLKTYFTIGLIFQIVSILLAVFAFVCAVLALNYSMRLSMFVRRKQERDFIVALQTGRIYWQVSAIGLAAAGACMLILGILKIVFDPFL